MNTRRCAIKIINEIDQYITSPHIIDKRGRFAHYPSEAKIISRLDGEIIGKCHRASWYDWVGEEPSNPIDARGRWTFLMGKLIEGGYIEYCKQIGIWAGNNVHMYDRIHNISGEADLFVFNEEHRLEGAEIKTAYGYGFQQSVSKFPKIENLLQSAIYLDYFPISCYHLIYKARDTQEDVEYIITIEADKENNRFTCVDGNPCLLFYLQDIYDQYRILGEYVVNKQLPPRDYTYMFDIEDSRQRFKQGKITKTRMAAIEKGNATDSDWHCLYCSYLDKCYIEKRSQMKLKETPTNIGENNANI
jgi:hypothetical protein